MLPSMNGGLANFALGGAFAIALELGVHILVHYTVPGAMFASNLAQGLAPVMDSLGLTTIFGDAAINSTMEATSSMVGECTAGGFCPIHNPIVGDPLISPMAESVPVSVPELPIPSNLEGLPVLGR